MGQLAWIYYSNYFKDLSVLMLCTPVFILTSTWQLSCFRVPILWFINLTVATCHIQYHPLSLCQFVSRENRQNTKILGLPFVWFENSHQCLLGVQSTNIENMVVRPRFESMTFHIHVQQSTGLWWGGWGRNCLLTGQQNFKTPRPRFTKTKT